MKQTLKGTALQHFAQEDLREMISPDTLARIKQKDADPLFKAFAIAHEGEASAEIVGTGKNSKLRYFRDAIIKIGNALAFATPAFYRHEGNDGSGNNSHRDTIGEVVGKTFKEIGGKLHAIAAFYIYPKFRKMDLNASSYEADIEMSMEQDGGVRVDDVARITGIALSDRDRPGFPGATLMATMQAFSAKKGVQAMAADEITLGQVKAYIRNQGVTATDIFTKDELRAQIEEWRNATNQIKRLETELQTEKDAHVKTKEDTKTELKKLNIQFSTVNAAEMLKSIATERKLSPQMLAHINKNWKAFLPTTSEPEALKLELQKFADFQIKDLDETLKALNLKPEEHGGTGWKAAEETPEQKTAREAAAAGGGAGSGDGAAGAGKDFNDPKNNELIPQIPGKSA